MRKNDNNEVEDVARKSEQRRRVWKEIRHQLSNSEKQQTSNYVRKIN